jgi:DGQHR domain-containing protein
MSRVADLRARAIRFEQNARVFYTTVLPAREWLSRGEVDHWSDDLPEDETGYQRLPTAGRLREVAAYLEGENAIMPLGGLINARSPEGPAYGEVLRFEPDRTGDQGNGIQSGWLTIPDAALPLYIVDMQHRLGGVARAIEDGRDDLADYPLVATIADGLSKLEEIEQFELINTTQKKVRTDLARRLMTIQSKDAGRRLEFERRGRLWEARGPLVAAWLNKKGVAWAEKILPPNKSKRDMPKAIVPETSFVTSLKPILQAPLFQHMPEDQVASLIDRYWQAIMETFPEAFVTPPEYVIQKTPGVFALHQLAPGVVELVRASNKELSIRNFRHTIEPWAYRGSEFWSVNEDGAARFGSMKGFSQLAAELRADLPKLDVDL